jgi:hypothetical protein
LDTASLSSRIDAKYNSSGGTISGAVTLSTTSATPSSLLGKDGSNVVGTVTTVAQTGLMKAGSVTQNTSSVGIISVAHGLSYEPTQVIVTLAQQNSYIVVCHDITATTLFFTVYDSVTGNPLNNISVGIFWLAIKKINMKQLLFLLLFPCLALAQYPGNAGNQKITLGEQTTADGLVYRGLAADTTRKPSVDTMAYILLDTNTNIIWQYKKATNNAWTRVGGSISSGVTGVLPVANGGTGSATQNFVDLTTTQSSIGGAKTFTSGISATTDNRGLIIRGYTGAIGYGSLYLFGQTPDDNNYLFASNGSNTAFNSSTDVLFNIGGITKVQSLSSYTRIFNDLGVGTIPTEALHVVGNGRFTAVGAGAYANDLNITSTGVLTTASSDEKYKYNILPINYGLNTILQLKPVNFQWIKGEENDIGFIAQDVADIIPEAVDTNWDSDLLMRYESIIPILTKAIQEQQALIKALEQRILTLENK